MEAKESDAPFIINLINSIIGVSVLAMPFCLKKCGLILGVSLIIGMSWLTYISCNMLVTAAVAKRRRTYEYLAFYTIGPTGKFAVELSMIGLMLGTCVAFYVIIGDLATAILQEKVEANPEQLRTYVIVFCALCIALPLGLMKNLSVLGFIGVFSMVFYGLFVCVMLANSVSSGLFTFAWMEKVDYFRPAGVFQCLPIFSLAYACQCQLFVVYDSLEDATLMRMERIVATSLKLVTFVYCTVAVLGYTAYIDGVDGNVLKNFKPDFILDLIKMGFAISVVVGFPLMIFPCRQSIHTLFFSQQPIEGVASKTYIEPFMFKAITLGIVLFTMMVALFIPNVETILGLTGATMGSFICFIFPGIIFTKASPKEETGISKFVLGIGCVLLILCTYSNIYSATSSPNVPKHVPMPEPVALNPDLNVKAPDVPPVPVKDKEDGNPKKPPIAEVVNSDHRHEPKNPIEPIIPDIAVKESKDHLPYIPDLNPNVEQAEANQAKEDGEVDIKPDIPEDSDSRNQDVKQVLVESEDRQPIVQENLGNKVDVQEEDNNQPPKPPVNLELKKDLDRDTNPKLNIVADGVGMNNNPVKKDQVGNVNVVRDKNEPVKRENEAVKQDAQKSEKSYEDGKAVEKLAESIDEEKLLDQIKKHQQEQHELLHKEEALIKALEMKQNVQQVEKQNPVDSQNDKSRQAVNNVKKDLNSDNSDMNKNMAQNENVQKEQKSQVDLNVKVLQPNQNNEAIQKPGLALKANHEIPVQNVNLDQNQVLQRQKPNDVQQIIPALKQNADGEQPPSALKVKAGVQNIPNANVLPGEVPHRNSREAEDDMELNQEEKQVTMLESIKRKILIMGSADFAVLSK